MGVDKVGHIVTLDLVVENLGWHGRLTGMSDKSLYTNGNGLVRAIQLIRRTIVGGLTIPSQ